MNKPRVLIVEDNVDNYELVRFLLERAGYQVLSASNGVEGVDAAKREQPDMILMDLSMPEMDGWKATAHLKSDDATRKIPVLALTAHTLPGDRKRAIDAGCDGYISKPINVASFDKLVATLLRQARADLQS
ncbi:MAG: response regulator [Anaerolineaceae bacterium]|nr:MAG: response regulator [Anaerolineaceae bacterium]